MSRQSQQTAVLLHLRPYRNSSLLIVALTEKFGRISCIAHSARGVKSKFRNQLQLFRALKISWSGKTDLKVLQEVEPIAPQLHLQPPASLFALHINELLYHLLPRELEFKRLFIDYLKLMDYLQKQHTITKMWRICCYFQLRLLEDLGYQLPLTKTVELQPIQAHQSYQYLPSQGFEPVLDKAAYSITKGASQCFSGNSLLALTQRKISTPQQLADAKRLLTYALQQHLVGKQVHSVQLLPELA